MQSYGRFNGRPGFGLQLLWRRMDGFLSSEISMPWVKRRWEFRAVSVITATTVSRSNYLDNQENFLSKAAFSLTGDIGCEHAAA